MKQLLLKSLETPDCRGYNTSTSHKVVGWMKYSVVLGNYVTIQTASVALS